MKKFWLLTTLLIGSLLLTGCNKTVENPEIIDDCVTVDWEDSCVSDINEPVVDEPIEDCKRYFDGCNRCTMQDDWERICTQEACKEYEEAYCADEQYDEFLEDIKSSWEQPQGKNNYPEEESQETNWDMPVAKMRVLEWQTEEETQAMVEEACSNMWWNWVDGGCVLEDGSVVNF